MVTNPELPWSKQVQEELQTATLRISAPFAGTRLWEKVFTEEERERLGGDLRSAYGQYRSAGMWLRVRGGSPVRAVIDAAHALNLMDKATHDWLLRETGESPETAKERAIESGCLVISERPREVYWEGELIDINWERRSALWEFLWILCKLAKGGKSIDYTELGEDAAMGKATKQKSRLCNTNGFPTSLGDYIKAAGRGSYKLDLQPTQIRIFEIIATEVVREVSV